MPNEKAESFVEEGNVLGLCYSIISGWALFLNFLCLKNLQAKYYL